MTALAVISSPVESMTPVATPFCTRISITSEFVRISTPAALADEAIAWVTEPIPPAAKRPTRWMRIASRANQHHQRASGRPWAKKRSENSASRDQSPASNSVSKYSEARSATAMRVPSAAGEHIFPCPVCESRGPSSACSTDRRGWDRQCSGASTPALRNDFAHLGQRLLKLGYFAASFCEKLGNLLRGFVAS
jgi:hypothetical protein